MTEKLADNVISIQRLNKGARYRASNRGAEAATSSIVDDYIASSLDVDPDDHNEKIKSYEIDVLRSLDDETLDLFEELETDYQWSNDANYSNSKKSIETYKGEDGYVDDSSIGQGYDHSENDTFTDSIFSKEDVETFGYVLDRIENFECDKELGDAVAVVDDEYEELRRLELESKGLYSDNQFYTGNGEGALISSSGSDSDSSSDENSQPRREFDVKQKFNLLRNRLAKGINKIVKDDPKIDFDGQEWAANYEVYRNGILKDGEEVKQLGQEQGKGQTIFQGPFVKKVQWDLLSRNNTLRPINSALKGQKVRETSELKTLLPYRLVPYPEKKILRLESRYDKKKKHNSKVRDSDKLTSKNDPELYTFTEEMMADKSFEEILEIRITIAQYHKNYNAITLSRRGIAKKQEIGLRSQNGKNTKLHTEQRLSDMKLENDVVAPYESTEGCTEVSSDSSEESSENQNPQENNVQSGLQNQGKSLDKRYQFSNDGYIFPLEHPPGLYSSKKQSKIQQQNQQRRRKAPPRHTQLRVVNPSPIDVIPPDECGYFRDQSKDYNRVPHSPLPKEFKQ
ncbi:hypothetical protein BN7_6579 [Wickerhamomyces ciferrii]|uniref:Uncharacterized protein n=1 Tax=Wickerhamomyces ciferrii (strain ATCC 14091 / BCRC 22168 / CBS 111 / JCM 3599 / NBRC 0793 / NRRL Y-1031 F-60-10) TaxID=1206466 RepID=K0KY20_WICCF|nr:uncharacterized protein BN7_6579 [Wickerhamomyces ciferrii]CCH46972.1 hypothetical protein BN7_6579 [Wickerhamomyces ciferrii]